MNDPSVETQTLMTWVALTFRKSLENRIGEKSRDLGLSPLFFYLVDKDSLRTPKWYSGISGSTLKRPIVANGKTDVDDAKSTLHDWSGIGFKGLGKLSFD